MLIVNGVNRPIGSTILADSFSTDRLVTVRLSAYPINSERSYWNSSRITSQCMPSVFTNRSVCNLAASALDYSSSLWFRALSFSFGGASTVNWFFFSSSCFIRLQNGSHLEFHLRSENPPSFMFPCTQLVAQVHSFILMKHSPCQIVNI